MQTSFPSCSVACVLVGSLAGCTLPNRPLADVQADTAIEVANDVSARVSAEMRTAIIDAAHEISARVEAKSGRDTTTIVNDIASIREFLWTYIIVSLGGLAGIVGVAWIFAWLRGRRTNTDTD